MNFFQFPAIAANETTTPKTDHVTPDDIQLPLTWITGGLLATILLGFTIIWWVSRLKFNLEEAQKRLDNHEKQVSIVQQQEHTQRIELRDGLRADLKRDIAESALTIMGELKLFALEIRQNINNLSEKLEGRDATVNRMGRRVDHLNNELLSMSQQLQRQNIDVHARRIGDNGPVSGPYDYSNDD
jgi:uncharacterized protein YoxC